MPDVPQPSVDPRAGVAGRGASANIANRFERLAHVPDEDPQVDPAEASAPTTLFLDDRTRSIITANDSPDLGFESSFNPYRGCEHGCSYCYARPTHEYLGMSAGTDFETRILVKREAPRLLRDELMRRSWRPRVLMVSGVTDCYQPIERRLRLTRECLAVLAEFRNPVSVITKNALVARDVDVLARLAEHRAVCVTLSLTTLRPELSQAMEPRASVPAARLAAVRRLADAGIPVGVNLAPIVPGLTDQEIPALLAAAAEHGATHAGYQLVRLPHGVAPLFEQWLAERAPLAKDKVLARLRDLRGGRLNDPRFGSRMTGEGIWATQLVDLFRLARRKAGIPETWPELSTAAFRRPGEGVQQTLFDLG